MQYLHEKIRKSLSQVISNFFGLVALRRMIFEFRVLQVNSFAQVLLESVRKLCY